MPRQGRTAARGGYWGLGLLLILSLLLGRSAQAREVKIHDIVVTNSSTDLLLFLKVMDAFSPEIVEGVKNGLAATFNFEVRVSLVREGWPDKEILHRSIDHTLHFDTLKNQYHLIQAEHGPEEITVATVDKALAKMAELNGVKLLSLSDLSPDRQYLLKVRAILVKKDLPDYVHYLIPFSNFWDVHTDWYTVRFRY